LRLEKTKIRMTLEIKTKHDPQGSVKLAARAAPSKTRTGDHTAKMRVTMKTVSTPPPEGLSRIIDILYTGINPERETPGIPGKNDG
jgi:hypothetical protein